MDSPETIPTLVKHEVGDVFQNKLIFSDEVHFHFKCFVNQQHFRIWGEQMPHAVHKPPLHHKKVLVFF